MITWLKGYLRNISNYYIIPLGWYQIFAFPIGCIVGEYYDKIQEILTRKGKPYIMLGILGLILVLFFKISISYRIYLYLPSIIYTSIYEIISLIYCASLILVLYGAARKGYGSRFLGFFGSISYELFLIHGVFLIKYNPIFGLLDNRILPFSFFLLLFFISLLSYIIHRTLDYVKKHWITLAESHT
jgi:peptidoglycan/LPS O-acetylase OafA/YrhL